MRKGKIRYVSERDLTEVGAKHVIIEKDKDPCVNPVTDYDNLFYLHSNVTRKFCANESVDNYPGLPVVEILDEDGYGTGEYKPEESAFLFPVAAYIHGGISLSLGSGSHFPDRQRDVTHTAAWMWTDKKRFCELCGERNWMHVYDYKTMTWRPAKSRDEFAGYLRGEAKILLEEWQRWYDGEVYGYRTETSYVPYKKLYPDGTQENAVAWEDGEDSCGGFATDKADDIDFPRGDGWEVFDATGRFVGCEYGIPEFVVTKAAPDGARYYLLSYTKDGANGVRHAWTSSPEEALRFPSWSKVQSAAQDVIEKDRYDARRNCVEVDSIGGKEDQS